MPADDERDDGQLALGRRGFVASSAGALTCRIGDERVSLRRAGDAAKADAAAARVRRPTVRRTAATPGAGATETLTFTTPQPQPGGVVREYWIQARDVRWDVIPSRPRRDQWHGRA